MANGVDAKHSTKQSTVAEATALADKMSGYMKRRRPFGEKVWEWGVCLDDLTLKVTESQPKSSRNKNEIKKSGWKAFSAHERGGGA